MTAAADPRVGPGGEAGELADALRLEAVRLKAGAFEVGGVSLRVGGGELATLSGPVGSGKSTLAAAVAGVIPCGGRVWVGGRDVMGEPPERRAVGWVPQDGGLLPNLTAGEQIAFPLRVRGVKRAERWRRAAETAEAWGCGGLLSLRQGQLSGGQARLVSVARAAAAGPRLMLLDEPLASLDAELRAATVRRLRVWAAETGGGVLLISHRAGEVKADADFAMPAPNGA